MGSAGRGLAFDGDPDGAVVVGVGFLAVDAVVPFDVGVAAEFVLGVAGEPFAEDAGVHALEGFGDGADAVEHRPVAAGEFIYDHAFGDFAACVSAGDEVAETAASDVVYAHAVLADAVVHEGLLIGVGGRIAGVDVGGILRADFIPEPGDFGVCGFVVEFLLEADDFEGEHRGDLVIHVGASLDGQGYVEFLEWGD